MDIFLNVFQDPKDQTIKIKLDCVVSNEDAGFDYVPKHLIKDIMEYDFNALEPKPTFQFSQLILSQYIKSKTMPPLKCIDFFSNLHEIHDDPDSDDVTALEDMLDKIIELPDTVDPFFTTRCDEAFTSKNNIKFTHSSVVYTLPENPLLALQLLTCLSIYFDQTNADITFSDFSPDDYAPNYHHRESYIFCVLLKDILELKNDAYDNTLKALNSLYIVYKKWVSDKDNNSANGLTKCIASNHCHILWPTITSLLIESKQPHFKKINGLLNEACVLIHTDRQKELNQMLLSINYTAKRALLESSIGKLAHDQGKYRWKYTEFMLILDKDTQFTVRKDGRMSISNFQTSFGYQLAYAEGQGNHAIIQEEMTHLFNCLGLAFERCDFHEEMVFTVDSSKQLIAKGLHFTLNYVQNIMKVQNHASFFKRHLQPIPQDALNTIALDCCEPLVDEEAMVVLRQYQ
jgi:hypothetical protein